MSEPAEPRRERVLTALLFCWFFLTVCTYSLLRPVRSSLLLFSLGPAALPWVYMGTALATGIAVFIFSKCAGLPRKRLIGSVLALFSSNLFAWWWIAGQSWGWVAPAFYVWTDVFSIMAVTVFWMYANDLFPPAAAKRVFGLIVSAGAAGGSLGSWLTESLVGRIGTVNMLLIAGASYSAILGLLLATERLSGGRSAERAAGARAGPKLALGDIPDAMRLLFASRFLLLLTAVACCERLVPDFSDYLFQTLTREAYPLRDGYTEFFARFEKWRNLGALILTVFLTKPLLQRLGVRFALASVPFSILVLGAGFLLAPGLAAAVLLKGVEEGQRHSWFKAGKEVSYTATDREVIYRIKGYIEMFFYRFSRGVAGFLLLMATTQAGLGPRGIAALMLPLAAFWLWAAWQAGCEFQRIEADNARNGKPATSRR